MTLIALALLLAAILPGPAVRADPLPYAGPGQVHLAVTGDATRMTARWATDLLGGNTLEYGKAADALDHSAQGITDRYDWPLVFHTVKLTGLDLDTTYYYHVGRSGSWSATFNFRTGSLTPRAVTVGAVADMGTTDEADLVTSRMAADASLDLVVFPGDLSYANGLQPIWDDWGDQVQAFTATRPTMFSPGNHENEPGFGFDAYLARVYTPYQESGSASPFRYSFNFSTIHFVTLSSEHEYGPGSEAYRWLRSDLVAADKDRDVHPWIVFYTHRPLYSSNAFHGSEMALRTALEGLLHDHQVDLTLAGHDHSFERTYPVYQGDPLDTGPGSAANPYINPAGPINVVVGTGGGNVYDDITGQHDFVEPQPVWSAYREATHGYSRFTVTPQGTLHFQYLRAADDSVAHEFYVRKTTETPPPAPPLAVIDSIIPSPAESTTQVSFTGHGESANGSSTAYRWRSSLDGELSREAHFTSTALSLGLHAITFQVADESGVWSEPATTSLWVYARPVAAAGADLKVRVDEQVTLTGTGSDADGNITTYRWDFDGDGTFDWTLEASGPATTTYPAVGAYTARLQVTDNDNFTATDTLTVTVLPAEVTGGEGEGPLLGSAEEFTFTALLTTLFLVGLFRYQRNRAHPP